MIATTRTPDSTDRSWQFDRVTAFLMLAAAAVAGLGQVLFTPLEMLPRGRIVYGLALVIALIVAACTRLDTGLPRLAAEPASDQPSRLMSGACLASAILLGAIAAALSVHTGGSPGALICWIAALVLVLVAAGARWPRLVPGQWRIGLPVAALLALALLLRLPWLDAIPPDVHIDEATMGLESRKVLNGDMPALLTLGWDQYPSLGFALHAPAMALVGDSLTGLRLTSLAGGLATIGLTVALGRLLAGGFAGLAAGALLTLSHWHIHLSRMGLHYMDAMVVSLASIYLVTRGVLRGSTVAFAGAGIALGLCFYVYYTARLSAVIVVGILAAGVIARRAPIRWWGVRVGWLALGALMALAPLLAVYAQSPEAALARSDRVSIFAPRNFEFVQRTQRVESVDAVLRFQGQRAIEMFNLPWDTSGQFGSHDPLLDPFSAVFFALGVAVAAARLLTFAHVVLLGWLVAVLLGVTLTNGAPFSPRAVIALPAVVILASIGLGATRDALRTAIGQPARTRWLGAALCALLTAVALFNVRSYFQQYTVEWHPAGFATSAGRLLASAGVPEPVTIIGGPEASRTIDIIRFLAPNAAYETDFESPYDGSGRTYIIDARTPDADAVVASVQASTRNAVVEPYRDPTGRLLFTLIRS